MTPTFSVAIPTSRNRRQMKGRLLSTFSGPLRSIRAAARTVVFFVEVLPTMPSKPVDWLTSEPQVERVRHPTLDGEVEADLYRPSSAGPYPGVVVCLGVVPFGVDHPQVPRLGAALARSGFAALLYWSPTMRDFRLDPADAENLALAYRWLIEQPQIEPSTSGLLGTCVGGSFAMLAAAESSIRDQVGFVVAWAPFASMRTLARDVASATTSLDGVTAPWEVDQLTRKVFVRSLTAVLEPVEAERLQGLCGERAPRMRDRDLSEDGRALFPLLTALDADAADEALGRLPIAMRERLDAMSPIEHVFEINAPLVLLAHDRDDQVIPIGESRRLCSALAGRSGVQYTEFTMFKHLDPTKVRLPVFALARELFKFYRAVYPMFRQEVAE